MSLGDGLRLTEMKGCRLSLKTTVIDKRIEKQTDRQANRQTDRQTDDATFDTREVTGSTPPK